MSAADRRDSRILAGLAALVSIGALVFYYRQGALLLYGDAVAHMNIARRVFDSRTPSLLALGTVWLPLPHLLDIPFVVNDRMWQSGIGASIPSMLSYIAGGLGLFRLVRAMASRTAAWTAAATFLANPNLIYMQATAMTEALYLALFVWAAVFFAEFVAQCREDQGRAGRALRNCGWTTAGAMLVRYDGWFLAAVIAGAAAFAAWRLRPVDTAPLRRGIAAFLLLTGVAAGAFLLYNLAAFGSALEFATGEYSAKAIRQRSRTATMPSYPGENAPRDAALQFLKIARLNLAEGRMEKWLLAAAFAALLATIYFARRFLAWSVLWTPAVFYLLCIAWGSVPVYQPEWWPFTYYNVRYGLQMLPAVAVFVGLAVEFAGAFVPVRAAAGVMGALAAASYLPLWQQTPICLREAHRNGEERVALERAVAAELKKLPPSAGLMMDCSVHSGAVTIAGIPFRRVLREGNSPDWKIALRRPAQFADYIIVFPGDAVAQAVERSPEDLRVVARIGTPSQPKALIYATGRR